MFLEENRAVEAAKKAISSPLLETSIDGAKGVIMNITGGTNLSLYEVQEAADIVQLASDEEVNMIFGSVINDNLNDEIIVTVIATGFSDDFIAPKPQPVRPSIAARQQAATHATPIQQQPNRTQEQPAQHEAPRQQQQQNNYQQEDALDIPTFLRNRRNR